MSAEKTNVEMMGHYRMPATPEEGSRFSMIGWGVFALSTIAILAMTVYFS